MKAAVYNLFKFIILLLFLQSMFAWFLWESERVVLLLSIGITVAYSILATGSLKLKKSNVIPIILLMIVELYTRRGMNFNSVVLTMLIVIFLSILISLNNEIKVDLLQFFTKAFAYLLSISLFAWILFLLGLSLPHYETNFNDNQYIFDNYYFFLFNKSATEVIPRFSSVFLEPGQLGMITTFLICANKFDLKNKLVLIIFIATLFTLSLAAYIMLITAVLIYITLDSKKPIRNIMLGILFIAIVFIFASTFNNGDNVVNNLIFSRLKVEDGNIAGNNRFTEDLNFLFDQFMDSSDSFWGIGVAEYANQFRTGGAGYKVFIVQHGLICTLFVFLFYFFIVIGNISKMAWILLLTYILCFLQASYPLWQCELLIFITAIPTFKQNIHKKIQYNEIS